MDYAQNMKRLNTALSNIDAAYASIAKRHGLTFNSLMTIYLICETDGITQIQICNALYLPKSTVHSILRDFIKRDYVKLVEGNNKKEKKIIVTSTGDLQFTKILHETQTIERNVLDAIGEKTCDFLIRTAEALGNSFNKEIHAIYGVEG